VIVEITFFIFCVFIGFYGLSAAKVNILHSKHKLLSEKIVGITLFDREKTLLEELGVRS
jgi:hypothetical protein